jgi:hypothetical protein
MAPVAKPCSNLVLQLNGPQESEYASLDQDPAVVELGDFAAIKIAPTQTGDIHIRIVKHGRLEDLFPADFVVHRGGRIRAQQHVGKEKAIQFGKYDFEIHVDEEWSHLLEAIDWMNETSTGRDSTTTLVPENDTALRTGIFIKSNGEVREYTNDKIHLRILDFDIIDEDDDGVFEPGDFIRIENIKVANIGIFFPQR